MAETKSLSPGSVLRFGVFQVNLAARELRKHGVRIRLPGQPFCILSILLEKPGEVITREEIRRRLWSSDTFVDFEHSLNSAIKKLRAALGDSPENSRYIETVPRVGYRFIAPVEQVSLTATTVAGASAVMDRSGVPAAAVDVSGKRRERMLLEFAIVLVVVPSAYLAWSRFRSRSQPQVKIASEIRNASNGHESARSNGQPVLSPKSAEAQELYRKGMYFWSKRTVGGFQQAIEYFQQATTIDPNYALAYAGLANSYTLLTAYSSSSATLYMPQARAAASLDDPRAKCCRVSAASRDSQFPVDPHASRGAPRRALARLLLFLEVGLVDLHVGFGFQRRQVSIEHLAPYLISYTIVERGEPLRVSGWRR